MPYVDRDLSLTVAECRFGIVDMTHMSMPSVLSHSYWRASQLVNRRRIPTTGITPPLAVAKIGASVAIS